MAKARAKTPHSGTRTGLVMTGGGARAAYQVGVLRAVCESVPRGGVNPFPIICGTSAGAINAAALASYARDFRMAVRRLNHFWHHIESKHVFRTDAWGVIGSGAHWLSAMMFGGLGKRNPKYLLNRKPMRAQLALQMPIGDIQKSIDEGALKALGITVSGYSSGESVTFYQGDETLTPWRRVRRLGVQGEITYDHLMASSAIPLLFEAVHINREYFGDGSIRQTAPISPALHLGADRVLVIGVNPPPDPHPERHEGHKHPSLAQVAGHVLNSIFLDSMEMDIERLERINHTVSGVPERQRKKLGISLRKIETLVISPSEDLSVIAARHAHRMPRSIRFLLRGVGAGNPEAADLVSYLLFEKAYCSELVALGYKDAKAKGDALSRFITGGADWQDE